MNLNRKTFVHRVSRHHTMLQKNVRRIHHKANDILHLHVLVLHKASEATLNVTYGVKGTCFVLLGILNTRQDLMTTTKVIAIRLTHHRMRKHDRSREDRTRCGLSNRNRRPRDGKLRWNTHASNVFLQHDRSTRQRILHHQARVEIKHTAHSRQS